MMNKFTRSSLSLAVIGLLSCTTTFAGNLTTQPQGGRLTKFVASQQRKGLLAAPKVQYSGKQSKVQYAAPVVNNDPVASLSAKGEWGMLEGEDGTTWFYTINRTASNGYYTGADLVLFDNNHEQVASFHVDIPEGKKVNDITPMGMITSKLYDKDASTKEVTISMHAVGDASNNYQGTYYTRAYRYDGTLVKSYEGSGVMVSHAQNSWTTYTRLLLVNDVTEQLPDSVDEYGDSISVDYELVDVMRPASWGEDEPQKDYTFKINLDNTYYAEGSPLNVFVVDNKVYYTISTYAKPFTSGYDMTTWEPIFTPDNSYVITTYDQRYSQVDSIAVPLTTPSDAYVRMAGFGAFPSNNLSKNYFTADGNFDYVLTFADYMLSKDDNRYSFSVYNTNDGKVKDICDNVYNTWFDLASIEGQSDQVAFMQETADAQQIQIVNVPSCEKSVLIPAEVEGVTISTDLNRYPVNGSYQYVIKMLNGIADDDNNTIARIGWYNADLSLDHYTSFNLGPNGENFRINLSDNVLNPYLFNTDDSLEFCYIAKVKRTDSNKIDDVLVIADENGNTLRSFTRNEEEGDLYSASVLTDDASMPELLVVYRNDDTQEYKLNFYSLPFTKFTKGGDGTKTNPYLISTVGDLAQVQKAPNASYKVANDIDMSKWNKSWTPINNFGGRFDGDDHVLSNLYINGSEDQVGLFGALNEGAYVSNLVLGNPHIICNSNTAYVGCVAAIAVSDTLSNIHVYNALIEDDPSASYVNVGGLVGQAALYSAIQSSSFDGTINTPSASPVGGIAGDIRTSTSLLATSASGNFTASSTLGGIVGSTGNGSRVLNSHSSANLLADNTLGGIVADNGSREKVFNCYSTGTIEATGSSWSGACVGGIVGSLGSQWETDGSTGEIITDTVVWSCVSASNIKYAVSDEGADATVHRIVGKSISNDWYDEGQTPETDKGLHDNYVSSAVTINDATVASDDARSVEGASSDASTWNTDFFTDLGYAFGETTNSPWKSTATMPVLYFENQTMAIALDKSAVVMPAETTTTIVATVYGADASSLDYSTSDESIVSVEDQAQTDNSLTIKLTAVKEGTATISVTSGNVVVKCPVTVTAPTAVHSVVTPQAQLNIVPANGLILAEGATSMKVYTAAGRLVAKSASSSIATTQLAKGVYVVVAADAQGHSTSAKVIVK